MLGVRCREQIFKRKYIPAALLRGLFHEVPRQRRADEREGRGENQIDPPDPRERHQREQGLLDWETVEEDRIGIIAGAN